MLLRDDAAWDAFVEGSATPTHLQTTAWARVKASGGWKPMRLIADGGSGPIGAQVLVRRIGPGPFSIGYAPRGPIATAFDEASLLAFTTTLRQAARRHRLTHVTSDPALEGSDAATVFRALGWRPSDPIQHDRSRLVDLTRPEDELWAALRPTARWSVNRARRDGCTVVEGTARDLATFHAILVETARRSGFIHRSLDAYRHVYEAFADRGEAQLLFAQLADGTRVATLLLISCGGRVTQPYGAMTASGARSRANYLLHWESIRRSAAAGHTVYDMWGLANAGIAEFKQAFGGREVHYCGTWDLVTLPWLRDLIVASHRGYVALARRRRGLCEADPAITICEA